MILLNRFELICIYGIIKQLYIITSGYTCTPAHSTLDCTFRPIPEFFWSFSSLSSFSSPNAFLFSVCCNYCFAILFYFYFWKRSLRLKISCFKGPLPSIRHQGPIHEPHPMIEFLMTVWASMITSPRMIELIILHPFPILTWESTEHPGPITAESWISAVVWIWFNPIN